MSLIEDPRATTLLEAPPGVPVSVVIDLTPFMYPFGKQMTITEQVAAFLRDRMPNLCRMDIAFILWLPKTDSLFFSRTRFTLPLIFVRRLSLSEDVIDIFPQVSEYWLRLRFPVEEEEEILKGFFPGEEPPLERRKFSRAALAGAVTVFPPSHPTRAPPLTWIVT
jgi:hypothetical protein